jgi:8-oxo-dGTP diphosphatase
MPQAVSRKQYRMMMAILHGKGGDSGGGRGRPPKSVAAKYTDPGKDAPEQSGEDRGGNWSEGHHKKDRERVKAARKERRKEKKKHLKKSFEEFYKGKAAATLIIDNNSNILLGRHAGGIAFPGGHVDSNESFEDAALREMKEECGVVGRLSGEIYRGKENGNDVVVYLAEVASGKPRASDELKNLKWYAPHEIPWNELRDCCHKPLEAFVTTKLGKSLKGMLAMEHLEKNIVRQRGAAVMEVTHGDALQLVGNGMFRILKQAVDGMQDEDFKDVHIDTYTLSIRKHMNDVYSGRVNDGHKMVYQFTNKSLPELTAGLMSVFEWYSPEDEKELNLLDEGALADDAIHGGLNELMENYKRHNIGNIYAEMETIRETMRNGMAVDLQQVESRIMTLFDKLEECLHGVIGKHNTLAEDAGQDIDELEAKLQELAAKIEEMGKRPETVEAYSSNPSNPSTVHDENYPYLPKPIIDISPNGKIRITFAQDWTSLEKENFLKDMRAKVIHKASKSHG